MSAATFRFETGSATHTGKVREVNEDGLFADADWGVWLVADGMGGHEAGEVASAIVARTIEANTGNGTLLVDAIQRAHKSVLQAVHEGEGAQGMGSTVVALLSNGQDYQVAWVGDSRAYLWTPDSNGGTLERLSTDHSYVQMLLQSGAIGEDEVGNHPDKNVITQCLGAQDMPELQVDSVKGHWGEKQWILLCSDGLTDEIDDELLAQTLCDARSVRDAVGKLMKLALSRGGRDNITLQIVESPLARKSPFDALWNWLPSLFGNRAWDGVLYGMSLVCLLLLGYWLLA